MALEQRSAVVSMRRYSEPGMASRSQRTGVGQLAIVSDARANANSILLYLLQNPPWPTTTVYCYSSLSTGRIDDSWLISDSLHVYMTVSTHY